MSEAKKSLHRIEGATLAGAVSMVPLSLLWAYANFWAFNHIAGEYIDFNRLAADYVVTLLASVVAFLLCFCITRFRSAVRSLFMTGAFLLMFFSYHHFATAIPIEAILLPFLRISEFLPFTLFFATAVPTDPIFLQIYAWLAATLLVCGAAYSLAKFRGFRLFALIVLPLTSIGVVLDAIDQRSAIHLEDKPGHVEPAPDITYKPWRGVDLIKPDGLLERRPNVYYLMVDSHLSNDAFGKFYQGDYSDFISYLESNGFFVGRKSHSNFPVTLYSVSSTLNMDFIVTEGPRGVHNTTARGYDMLAGRNPVAAAFRARGYRILYTMNGFLPPNRCSGFEDRCIRKKGRYVTLQELALVRLTPLGWVLNRFQPNWGKTSPGDLLPDLRDGTVAYFHSYQPKDIPGDIPSKAEWPFFWYVHFMGMHNLAFDSNCDYQHPKHVLGREPGPTRPFMQIAYREQVACLHKQLRVAVDAILAADPDAIIALQSDHGTTMVNNMRVRPASAWTGDDIFEIFSILNSIRVPENCRSRLYDSISPVNTFRVILGCLDDKDYELLPDDMYVAAYAGWWPDFPRVTKIGARGQIVGDRQ